MTKDTKAVGTDAESPDVQHLSRDPDRCGPAVLARHQHHILIAVRTVGGKVVRLQARAATMSSEARPDQPASTH